VHFQGFFSRMRREWQFYACGALAVLCAAVFAWVLHARTLPMAEGWYTYYASCIHQGLLPYRDFEYLYPPFYIYFIALFVRVFGYELIYLRRLGVVIFALIAWALYQALTAAFGKKHAVGAFFAVLAAVFYMQSEVVQIFYDYVRVMDLVNILAVWRLFLGVRALAEGQAAQKALIRCGFWLGLLLQIKQNTGLVMLAFCLVLWVFLSVWQGRDWRCTVKELGCLLVPALAVMAAVLAALAATGSLRAYFDMTWGRAAGAKGGLFALLFGWVGHNRGALLGALPVALFLLLLLVAGYQTAKRRCSFDDARVALAGGAAFLGVLLIFCLSEAFTAVVLSRQALSAYAVFLTVLPLFVAMGVVGVIDMVRHTKRLYPYLPFFALSGAYVAASFACANSGGLADGQAYFGIAFLALGFFLVARTVAACFKGRCCVWLGCAVRLLPALLCLLLALQSAGKKMLDTYNWWGMTESTYWQASERSRLPLLRGLRLSPETVALYEGVVEAIRENVPEGEDIYCFAHIPSFYTLTERSDPGVSAKVQWFDVASDAAVLADRAVLAAHPPRAILLYHTEAYAYEAHEASFRGGNVSGMRQMRDFLLDLVVVGGYVHYGDFEAHGNRLSVYILP